MSEELAQQRQPTFAAPLATVPEPPLPASPVARWLIACGVVASTVLATILFSLFWIFIGVALIVAGPLWALAVFTLAPRRRRSLGLPVELPEASRTAAYFASPAQTSLLLLDWVLAVLQVGGIAVIVEGLIWGSVGTGPVWIQGFSIIGLMGAFVLPALGCAALAFGIYFYWHAPTVIGQEWALAHRTGAHRRIRFTRRFTEVLLVTYTLSMIATIVVFSIQG